MELWKVVSIRVSSLGGKPNGFSTNVLLGVRTDSCKEILIFMPTSQFISPIFRDAQCIKD